MNEHPTPLVERRVYNLESQVRDIAVQLSRIDTEVKDIQKDLTDTSTKLDKILDKFDDLSKLGWKVAIVAVAAGVGGSAGLKKILEILGVL